MDYGFFLTLLVVFNFTIRSSVGFFNVCPGGQSLIYRIGKTDDELKLMLDSLVKMVTSLHLG